MKKYARIQNGRVMELVETKTNVSDMYHPALRWVDATAITHVAPGWHYDGVHWTPPAPPKPAKGASLAELQSRLALLSAQVAELMKAAASSHHQSAG